MGLFKRKKAEEKEINEMRLSERESVILSLEKEREDVVFEIEEVMREVSKELRQRRLRRKKRL